MPILVTGAAGHLGANLVRRLLADGEAVRVLLREGSNNGAVLGLPVEQVWGDLRDPEVVRRAVRGCGQVYHSAAKLSTGAGGEREIFECNVLGTRNLLSAALRAGVSRVVVTGSFSAVGQPPDRPADEEQPFYPFDEHLLPYSHTKLLVEHECWRACLEGLDVVVATSCAIIGPHDHKPSRMGQVLLDFARRRLFAFPGGGGFEFVAAADIVEGHLLAMRKGRKGQRYIFGSGFHTFDEMMEMMARVTGRPRPLRVPPPLMMAAAKVAAPLLARLAPRRQQTVTPAAVRLLSLARRADCTKAKTELGYRPTSIADALAAAYDDFARRGLVPARREAPVGGAVDPVAQPSLDADDAEGAGTRMGAGA